MKSFGFTVITCLFFGMVIHPAITSESMRNDCLSLVPEQESDFKSTNPRAYFTSALWRGEGVPCLKAKIDIQAHKKPQRDSEPVEGLVIKEGKLLEFTATQLQTIEPSLTIIKEELKWEVTEYGTLKHLSKEDYYSSGQRVQLHLSQGDKILYLQYRAEGQEFFEFEGKIYSGSISPILNSKSFPPLEAWWVKVNYESKKGWVLVDDYTVEFLPRLF